MAYTGNIGHICGVESPWGNAGGVVRTIEDVERMAHTGIGWIEAGSYTLEPRAGNGAHGERVYHHTNLGETYNSMGMPNAGMDVVAEDLPEMIRIARTFGKLLVVNVAPVTDDPVHETIELFTRAKEAGAEAILLNAGCPNVLTADGGRHEILSHNLGVLAQVLVRLEQALPETPAMVRTSPVGGYHDALALGTTLRRAGNVSAVFHSNTWQARIPHTPTGKSLEVPGETAGLSGPAIAKAAFEQTRWMVAATSGSRIGVISNGGIVSAGELQDRLDVGAEGGSGTTLYFESEDWALDTDRLLSDLAA